MLQASKIAHTTVVDLSQVTFEPHARKALDIARRIAGARPLNAADLIEGALECAAVGQTGAFAKLRSLLSDKRTAGKKWKPLRRFDLAAVHLDKPLARSYHVAETLLTAGTRVWGRDYVTLALLAQDDDSLHRVVDGFSTDLGELRQQWLLYLHGGDHRSPEIWDQWWRMAGVASSDEPERAEAAYLMTWNPASYPLSKMQDLATKLREDGFVEFGWSTGSRKDMELGSRIFLLRQGTEPRGLVGVGEVIGAVTKKTHWDKAKAAEGKVSLIARVRWTALSVDPFIDRTSLVSITGEDKLWSTQSGGVLVTSEPLRNELEDAWPTEWERHTHGLHEHLPVLDARHLIARFDADQGDSQDSLRIDRYVHAFARVMASRGLVPPLSIGLFGDWGSGKTFFMDQLHGRIETLATSDALGAQQQPLYWGRICQIRFNAWHYAETNLWASLVSTIFNQLRAYLDPDGAGGADIEADEFNKLLNKLEISTALRADAQKRVNEAEAAVGTAVGTRDKAEIELSSLPEPQELSDAKVREVLGRTLVEASGTSEQDLVALLEKAAELSGNARLGDATRLMAGGEAKVGDARELLSQTRGLAGRSEFWWRVLSTGKLWKTPGFWFTAAAAAGIPWIVFHLNSISNVNVDWLGALAEALTVGGAGIAWIRGRLAAAAPVFDQLDALQWKIEGEIAAAETEEQQAYLDRVSVANRNEASAVKALADAEVSLALVNEEHEAAKLELRESTSEARLGRFIRERAESADYDKYLGLIAMIHRDFQKLSDLMERARAGPHDPDLPRVDRIVLYIDDLDRCYPPRRVVRVLEAVHLLLFFPLFVVVVGVDSRWVSRALNKHYEDMLGDETGADDNDDDPGTRAPADSHDFLEKIFQVPFWLRKMDPSAVRATIGRLITVDEVEEVAEPEPTTDGKGHDGSDDGDDGAYGLADSGPPFPFGGPTTIPTPHLVPSTRAAARRIAIEAEQEHRQEDAPTEGLRFSEAEMTFMDQVAPLMPRTPRSVKRFVNIYRLYKAALATDALAHFLGTPEHPGNFRAVQVLLALVTGTPRFAKAVYIELDAPEDGDPPTDKRLSNLVVILKDKDKTWDTTLDALKEFATGDNDLKLTALSEVSPLVGRYSVHHMVSRVQGASTLG